MKRKRALWTYRVEDTKHCKPPFFDAKHHGRPKCYVIQVTDPVMGITYDYDWTTEIEYARKKVAGLNR